MPILQLSPIKRRVISIGVALPLVLVAAALTGAWYIQRDLQETARWVDHTREVEVTIQEVLTDLLDGETGQRGYLISAQKEFLQPYDSGVREVHAHVDRLATLTADNAEQVRNVAKLRTRVDAKLAWMKERIELVDAGKIDEARKVTAAESGKRIMDEIRHVLATMKQSEEILLTKREAALNRRAAHARVFLWSLVSGAAICAAAVLWLLHRLGKVQGLVKMCAWSNTIEYDGEWISFSEYLVRKFNIDTTHGISPDELAKLRIMGVTSKRAA